MRITEPGANVAGPYGNVENNGDDSSVDPDIEMQLNALSTIPLEEANTSGSIWTYKVPADWHFTVVLDTDKHEFVLRDMYSDRVYVFYSLEQEGDPATIDLDDDSNANNDEELRGRLKQITTRQWYDADQAGWEFTYDNSDGRLVEVATPSPQNFTIEYGYGTGGLASRLLNVVVKDGSANTLMRVDYTYFDDPSLSPSDDVGSSGDLIQVKVTHKDSSGDDDVRYTQYRYYAGSSYYPYASGYIDYSGTLKAVYDHAAIQQMIADSSSVNDTEDILDLDDDFVVSGTSTKVSDYAVRSFEYALSVGDEEDTTAVDTGWLSGGSVENLHTTYGGDTVSDYPEFHELRVMAEHIGAAAGCTSCSGGGSARLTRRYHYVNVPQGASSYLNGASLQWPIWFYFGLAPNDVNEVSLLVIEDTFAHDDQTNYPINNFPNGRPLYRKIYGLNDFSRKLREVIIENPMQGGEGQDPLRCWCWAMTYAKADTNNDGRFDYDGGDGDFDDVTDDKPNLKHRVAEYRFPSAYDVTTNADLKDFLDPYDDLNTSGAYAYDHTANEWAHDNQVLRSSVGLIYVYEYNNAQGLRTDEWVKMGRTGTANYVSAIDWGDGTTANKPKDRMIARYVYPATGLSRSNGTKTAYEYTFWDSGYTQLKSRVTKIPAVVTAENGPASGSSVPGTASVVAKEEYFDTAGRLRWTKDGEGYVNYYSYNPSTGGLAYTAVDVASTLPDSADDSANNVKWVASTDGDADQIAPTRNSDLPTALSASTASFPVVSTHQFDEQGRMFLRTDPPTEACPTGAKHYTVYQVNRTLHFPYWDDNTNKPLLPIQVSELDESGRPSQSYTVDPSQTQQSSGVPTGLLSYVSNYFHSWTRYFYDPSSGHLAKLLRYHNISAGDGSHYINYFVTAYEYDALGQIKTIIDTSSTNVDQITQFEYDVLGRRTKEKRGAGFSFVDAGAYADIGDIFSSLPDMATTSVTAYDSGGIGDGHVTSVKKFYGTTSTEFVEAVYHRTFRGFLRAVERKNNTTVVLPHQIQDVDWLGRVINDAKFTSTISNFTTSVVADDDYVATISSGRNDWNKSYFDVLGRVYRSDHRPGTSSTSLQTNNYHDLNGRLVCAGDPYAAHTEFAYDGAGRQYQVRTVMNVASTPYPSGGKFKYRDPQPDPHWKAGTSGLDTSLVRTTGGNYMASGNDGLIEFTHSVYDAAGNMVQEHMFEANHDDTNGLSLTANNDYVRRSIYNWYDATDRLATMADYGSGDTTSGAGSWKYASVPGRPSAAPTASSDTKLVTTYGFYNNDDPNTSTSETGYNTLVIDSANKKTKEFFDDLGRRTYLAENCASFEGSPSSIGSGYPDEDRVTAWEYDGLGNVSKLKAYNGSENDVQVTEYKYADPFNASLVTLTKYPDGNLVANNVQMTYNLDGTVATRTDQRGVVHTYTYDTARRLTLDGATTIPSSVYGGSSETDAVRSIGRTYTDLGEPVTITSYANNNGTGTIQNEIKYSYDTYRNVSQIQQSHQVAVGAGTPAVSFTHDTTAVSGVLSNGLHRTHTYYPVATNARLVAWYGGDNSLTDRLGRSRYEKLWGGNLNGDIARTFYYDYNGVNRLAGISDDGNVSYTPNLKHLMYSTSGNYDSYDRFGRTVKQKWIRRSDSATYDEFKHGYDYAGNRLWRQDVVAEGLSMPFDQFYTYDGLHRLKSADVGILYGTPFAGTASQFSAESWTLDQLGNWAGYVAEDDLSTVLNQTRYHNKVDEIDVDDDDGNTPGASITASTGANWADPKYDQAGNMTTMPQPAGPVNVSTWPFNPANTFALKYDAWNRLVQVDSGSVASYEYDGLGQRIVKDVAGGTASDREYYYNDKWQLLTETKPVSSVETVEAIYHWHPFYVDALATRMRASDTHHFLHDANFNVTAAVDDSTDALVERYHYTPYGTAMVQDANFAIDADGISDIGNTHLYTGRERDPETGLQLNRHRYYASHLGRWITRDPIGYLRRNFNLYCFVDSRPLYYLDASGLLLEEIDDLVDVGGWDSWSGYNCAKEAEDASADLPGNFGGERDAVRHCTWLCCMTRSSIPDDQVREIADNHEKHGPPPKCKTPPKGYCSQEEWENDDRAMDDYNNEAGIEHGENSPKDCASACKDSLDDGALRVNSPGGYGGMSGCGGYY